MIAVALLMVVVSVGAVLFVVGLWRAVARQEMPR